MRVYPDCFPCFLRQSIIALRLWTKNESLQKAVLKSIFEIIQETDTSKPPAYTTTFIHRKIRQQLGKDPFKEIKSEPKLSDSFKTVIARSGATWQSISLKTRFLTSFGMTILKASSI
jgi:uncharacterized protein with ATP-grasp and redox domains